MSRVYSHGCWRSSCRERISKCYSEDEDPNEDNPGPDDDEEKPPERKIQKIEKKTTESQIGDKDVNMATDLPYTATFKSETLEKAKNTNVNHQQKEKHKQRHWKGWSRHKKEPGENPTCQEKEQPPPIPTSWAENQDNS